MSRILQLIVLLIVPLVSSGSVSAQQTTDASVINISFKDEVELLRRDFTLNEVANINTTDTQLLPTLRRVVIGKSPRHGRSLELSKFDVMARLKRSIPGLNNRLNWHGAATTKVVGLGAYTDGRMLLVVAQSKLNQWFDEQFAGQLTLSIKPVGDAEKLYLPNGKITTVARLSNATRLRARIPVWVDVAVDGEIYQTVPVWFAVSALKKVLVSNARISTEQRLTESLFSFEEREISGLSSTGVDHLPNGRYRLRRSLPPGEILEEENTQRIPEVVKNSLVTVLAQHGSVSLNVTARALSDGYMRDKIRVENPESGESYVAIVIGENYAKVE